MFRIDYLLEKVKFKLPTYAFAFELAVTLILNTILLPGKKPQVDGSADPFATPVCHDDTLPVETATVGPQALRPDVASFR